jgi:ABC-type multidrug transport system ATPase subunit
MSQIKLEAIARAASLDVINLTQRASGRHLLDAITLSVLPGECVGLLGPSGSGKSTLLKAACGLQRPYEGEVRLNGQNLHTHKGAWRHRIGYVPQDDIIHTELSLWQAIRFAAELRLPDLSADAREQLVRETIASVGLQERQSIRIAQLSGGQRKRASVAVELLTQPAILYLDEPTSGQDPHLEAQMMALFARLARNGCTVVITTHAMASIESLDLVAILHGGALVFYGPPTALLAHFDTRSYEGVFSRLASLSPAQWRRHFQQSVFYDTYVRARRVAL